MFNVGFAHNPHPAPLPNGAGEQMGGWYGGLTQSVVVPMMEIRTGAVVSSQLRNLAQRLESEKELEERVRRIERQLDNEQQRSKRGLSWSAPSG
jgi:hypothetical protein